MHIILYNKIKLYFIIVKGIIWQHTIDVSMGMAVFLSPSPKKNKKINKVGQTMDTLPHTTDRERELHQQIIALRAENEHLKNILAGVEHILSGVQDAVPQDL